MYATLRCEGCDNPDCSIGRLFIPEGSLEGCTRSVTDDQAMMLSHYENEVLPFVKMYEDQKIAQEKLDNIYQFLLGIYGCDIGAKLDERGKAVSKA